MRAISAIVRTASTGWLPVAVSAESITTSVPSKIAFATSLASARVGRGLRVMLSSICVAVITSRLFVRAAAMSCFWTIGTFSGRISTPRSPRATMMPSATSRIASMCETASGFSILAITGMPRAALG